MRSARRWVGFIYGGQDAAGAVEIACPGVGQRDRASGACSRRMPSRSSSPATRRVTAEVERSGRGGCGKAALLSDGDKGRHGLEVIHGIIMIIATVFENRPLLQRERGVIELTRDKNPGAQTKR